MLQLPLKSLMVMLLKLAVLVCYLVSLFYVSLGTYAGVYYFGGAPSRVEVPLWIEGLSDCGQYPVVPDCKHCPIVAFGDMPVLSSAASYYDASIELKLSAASSSQGEYVSLPFTSELTLSEDPPPLAREFCPWKYTLDLKRRAPGTNALFPLNSEIKAIGASKRGVVPYKRRLHRLLSSLFWTPFEIIGWHVPAQAVSTSIVHNIPRPSKAIRFAALTIDRGLEVLEIKLVWTPRHGGARYFMYNYRLLSLFIGVPLIWSILVVWSIITVVSLKYYLTGRKDTSHRSMSPALRRLSDFELEIERSISDAPSRTQPALTGSLKKPSRREVKSFGRQHTKKVPVERAEKVNQAPVHTELEAGNSNPVSPAGRSKVESENESRPEKPEPSEKPTSSEKRNASKDASLDTVPEESAKQEELQAQAQASPRISEPLKFSFTDTEPAATTPIQNLSTDEINLTPPATSTNAEAARRSPAKAPEKASSNILEQIYSNIMVSPDTSIETVASEPTGPNDSSSDRGDQDGEQ